MSYVPTSVRNVLLAPLLAVLMSMLLLSSGAWAQATQHQQWTTEDGLPQDSVHQILQSRDGFLWLATEGGVARFDGNGFLLLNRQTDRNFMSDDVCCIAQTSDGALWFGTADGLVRDKDGHTSRLAEGEGLPSAAILALAPADDRSLLVLTSAGLARVQGERAQVLRLPDGAEATSLSAGPNGDALVVAHQQLFRYAHGGFTGVMSLPPQTLSVRESPGRRLWIRTRSAVEVLGAEQTPQASTPSRTWQIGRDLPGSRTESLTLDGERAFVGTNRGAFLLDTGSSTILAVPQIGSPAVLAALVDAEGDRWFGTEASGLHVVRDRTVSTVPQFTDEVLTSVVEASDGTVWLGTRDDGLRIARDSKGSTPEVSSRLTSQVVLSLAPGAHGDVWVGTPDGLDHIQGSRVERYTSANGLPDDFVRSALVEESGDVWVGTRRGLARLRQGRVVDLYTRANGLHSEVIGALLRARNGDLWFGTSDGLARLRSGGLTVFTTADGLSGKTISALAQDADGTLWIGTREGGLSHSTDGQRFNGFTAPALRHEIDAILPDGHGALWIRNTEGIVRVLRADLDQCSGQANCPVPLRVFGTADGMPSIELLANGYPAAFQTHGGQLWFTTRKGAALVDRNYLPEDRVPPPIVLEDLLVDGRAYPLTGQVSVPPGQHRLQFVFAGLSFVAPSRVSYRYRLEGFDTEWTEAGNRRTAEYTNLPPGRYRFLVEAINNDGVHSSHQAALPFIVQRPFYRRWWFAVLLLLLLAAVVYAVYRVRLRQVQREFAAVLAERNRIAREIHDTLAQDFVGVSLQLEITAQLLKVEAVEAARAQIDQTRTLVRDGIRNARESIWALRANAASDTLPARLRQLVDRACTDNLAATLAIGGIYHALPAQTEGEILRIAGEGLQNVARHAGATRVEVALHYEEDVVSFEICDNGRGFEPAKADALEGHYGLRGMRERAATLGATLKVTSKRGSGTAVSLRVPARAGKRV